MKKIAMRYLALLLAMVMMAGLIPAAAEESAGVALTAQPEQTADAEQSETDVEQSESKGRLVLAWNMGMDPEDTDTDYAAYQQAARGLIMPLLAQSLSEARAVDFYAVEGGSVKLLQQLPVPTVEEISNGIDMLMSAKKGDSNKRYTRFAEVVGALNGQLPADTDELWYIQGFDRFYDDAKDGRFAQNTEKKMKSAVDQLIEIASARSGLKIHLVWYGMGDALKKNELWLDQEYISQVLAEAGLDDDQIHIHVINPAATGVRGQDTVIGLARHALKLPVAASLPVTSAIRQAEEAGAESVGAMWAADYAPYGNRPALVHISAQGTAVKILSVQDAATGRLNALVEDNEAWLAVDEPLSLQIMVEGEAASVTAKVYRGAKETPAIVAREPEGQAIAAELTWNYKESEKLYLCFDGDELAYDELAVSAQVQYDHLPSPTELSVVTEDCSVAGKTIIGMAFDGFEVGNGNLLINVRPSHPDTTFTFPQQSVKLLLKSHSPQPEGSQWHDDLYYNLLGYDNVDEVIQLSKHFTDKENEPLTYRVETPEGWTLDEQNGTLTYHVPAENPPAVTEVQVTAVDPYQNESAPIKLVINLVDCGSIVNNWALVCEESEANVLQGALEVEKELLLTLPDVHSEYAMIRDQYGLKPLEEMLSARVVSMTKDGVPVDALPECEIIKQENGDIAIRTVLPAENSEAEVNLAYEVLFGAANLPVRTPVLTVQYKNTAPVVQDGLATQTDLGEMWLSDLSAEVQPVYLASATDLLVPDELFTDAQTPGNLYYTVNITGAGAELFTEDTAETPVRTDGETAEYELTPDLGTELLDIRFTEAGNYEVIISARDQGGLQASETVSYTVTVKSQKARAILIGSIAAGVLALLLIVFVIIRIKTRPNFRGIYLQIGTVAGENVVLDMTPWNTHGVTLAQVAIAAQIMPMKTLPLDLLGKIALVPKRGRKWVLKASGEAENLQGGLQGKAVSSLRKDLTLVLDQGVQLENTILLMLRKDL